MAEAKIAVIGAGMAGLACAARLKTQGLQPVVFEKSRGLGGRIATRRTDQGLAFDHGAQYVTARAQAFQAMVEEGAAHGTAGVWSPRAAGDDKPTDVSWIVGVPAMNALVKPLAQGIEIRLSHEVAPVERAGGGWHLKTSPDGAGEVFDIVISTAPAPQSARLFAADPPMAQALGKVEMAPCWALMVAFAVPFEPGFDARRAPGEALAWLCRNGSKPGRPSSPDGWIVHAGPEWSREHLELEREEAAERLIRLLSDQSGAALPEIEYRAAHRWRYALTATPLGAPYLCSADGSLYAGGDWCLGARVEYALESGLAIAGAIAERLAP